MKQGVKEKEAVASTSEKASNFKWLETNIKLWSCERTAMKQ